MIFLEQTKFFDSFAPSIFDAGLAKWVNLLQVRGLVFV